MKPKPWSSTALDDFVNCPLQFWVTRVAPPEERLSKGESPEMLRGKEDHKHFENRQQYRWALPDYLLVHEPFMANLESLPGKAETEQQVALDRQQQPTGWQGEQVWWRGVIDYRKVHRSTALIVDYKTGRPHNKFGQLKLFALYTFAQYLDVKKVHCQFYWTTTQQMTGETYTRDQIPELWQAFVPNLQQYVEAFRTNTWQPRPSGLCPWCPLTTCEFHRPMPRKRR